MERGPGNYALKPARIGAAEPNKAFMHDWWNGRRASLRGWCLQRREGSSPLSCTWSTVSTSCDHLKLNRSAFLYAVSLTGQNDRLRPC